MVLTIVVTVVSVCDTDELPVTAPFDELVFPLDVGLAEVEPVPLVTLEIVKVAVDVNVVFAYALEVVTCGITVTVMVLYVVL